MRVIITSFMTGVLILALSALLAPQEAAVQSRSTGTESLQSVNRAGKGDRLMVPASTVSKPKKPDGEAPKKMLAGCDPVFSPLVASAKTANYPGRCIA